MTYSSFFAIPNAYIVWGVSAQFSWLHFVELIAIKEPPKREFYIGICRMKRRGVRTFPERTNNSIVRNSTKFIDFFKISCYIASLHKLLRHTQQQRFETTSLSSKEARNLASGEIPMMFPYGNSIKTVCTISTHLFKE